MLAVSLWRRSISSAVFLEHNKGKLNPASTAAILAAKKCPNDRIIGVLPVGNGDVPAIKEASKLGLAKILVSEHPSYEHLLPEVTASFLADLQEKHNFTHWWAANTSTGKSIFPRFAGVLVAKGINDVAPISDIIEVKSENVFLRPIYAGNALTEIKSNAKINILTIRPTSFPSSGPDESESPLENISFQPPDGIPKL